MCGMPNRPNPATIWKWSFYKKRKRIEHCWPNVGVYTFCGKSFVRYPMDSVDLEYIWMEISTDIPCMSKIKSIYIFIRYSQEKKIRLYNSSKEICTFVQFRLVIFTLSVLIKVQTNYWKPGFFGSSCFIRVERIIGFENKSHFQNMATEQINKHLN